MFYRNSPSGKQFKGQFTPQPPKNPTQPQKSSHHPATCTNLGQPQLWVPYPFTLFVKGWGIELCSTALLNPAPKPVISTEAKRSGETPVLVFLSSATKLA